MIQNPLDQHLANFAEDGVVLQRFAGDVQWQVGGIHQAEQKPEILRQQIAVVVLHQNSLGTQMQAMLATSETHVLETGARAIQNRVELNRRIGGEMQMPQRFFFRVMRKMLIKPGILFFVELAFGFDPDRALVVEWLTIQFDGMRNEGGILADDVFQAERVGESRPSPL